MDGNNAVFILTAPPEVYNLPAAPELPQRNTGRAFLSTLGMALGFGVAVAAALWGQKDQA
jgi:formate dehydrogenase iron-sulfur subunit